MVRRGDVDIGETIGVEEEFVLVDGASHRTASAAVEVLERARGTSDLPEGASVKAELLATQVEAATGVCGRLTVVAQQIRMLRRKLADVARAQGVRLVSVAHPVLPSDPPTVMPGRRFGRVRELYAEVVRSYQSCGCHVHVGVPDRDTAVQVTNHLRPWLPTLLAISVNSPFNDGHDTGYQSWRMITQSGFPGGGMPPHFNSADEYERELGRLIECGVLVDADMTFWLARPSTRFATVEVRAADAAASVHDALLQAALVRALVRTSRAEVAAGRVAPAVSPQVGAAAVWCAARYGLEGPGVDAVLGRQIPATELLRRLLLQVRPALDDVGDLEFVRRQVTALLEFGTGARRQRLVAARGPAGVVDMLARQTEDPGTDLIFDAAVASE